MGRKVWLPQEVKQTHFHWDIFIKSGWWSCGGGNMGGSRENDDVWKESFSANLFFSFGFSCYVFLFKLTLYIDSLSLLLVVFTPGCFFTSFAWILIFLLNILFPRDFFSVYVRCDENFLFHFSSMMVFEISFFFI